MTSKTGQRTVFSSNPYLVLNNQGEIIQPLELKADRHILGRDRTSADLLIPDDWGVISGCQAVLRKAGNDYHIYDGDGQNRSTNGLFINHTRITPTEGCRLAHGMEIQIGQNPQNHILLRYFNPAQETGAPPTQSSISLKNRSVLIGRDSSASLLLDAPTVSRRHATIEADAQGRYILQDYSTNGVFVNGQRVAGKAVLPDGAKIRIGPFTLIVRDDELVVADRGNNIRLDAYNLVREIAVGAVPLGGSLTSASGRTPTRCLLNDISLAIDPGQFVAVVGGSGAGKSTLMRSLLGIEPINGGEVYLNGENLRTNFNIYRTQIGYVPQDDIVHHSLKVGEVLSYAAKLRLPPDINVEQVVQKTLQQIEMTERRDVLVSQLSGGQRKRVSIGVELLADPKLFFLDEPTSGLDPGLEKKMMQLLRQLANEGRTVILVTHATANITLCDRIVFLGQGGRLCYFGTPKAALDFFEVKSNDFADIYNKLEEEKAVISESAKFRQSADYQHYIVNHLSAVSQQQSAVSPPKGASISPCQQLALLAARYLQLIWRDRIYLALSLLTAPISISLMPLAIRNKNPLFLGSEPEPTLAPLALRVLFVFTCAAIWVGLSSSLQEIVKESAIYLRERLVNLGLFPYLGSKVLILSGLAVLQTLLMAAVILVGFKSPQPQLISWPLGLVITTFLTLLTSMSLGLLVSSLVKNSSQANSALPLLLLPQIIFSGVLFKMEGIATKLSWLMLSRWSVGAYGALVNVNAMVPKPTYLPNGTLLTLPFDKTPVYESTWQNLGLNWGILLLHSLIYLTLTFLAQKRKDIF